MRLDVEDEPAGGGMSTMSLCEVRAIYLSITILRMQCTVAADEAAELAGGGMSTVSLQCFVSRMFL